MVVYVGPLEKSSRVIDDVTTEPLLNIGVKVGRIRRLVILG